MLEREPRPPHVDAERRVEGGFLERGDRPELRDARVEDEDVDPLAPLREGARQRLDVFARARVGRDDLRDPLELRPRRRERLGVRARDGDLRALGREEPRRGETDARVPPVMTTTLFVSLFMTRSSSLVVSNTPGTYGGSVGPGSGF